MKKTYINSDSNCINVSNDFKTFLISIPQNYYTFNSLVDKIEELLLQKIKVIRNNTKKYIEFQNDEGYYFDRSSELTTINNCLFLKNFKLASNTKNLCIENYNNGDSYRFFPQDIYFHYDYFIDSTNDCKRYFDNIIIIISKFIYKEFNIPKTFSIKIDKGYYSQKEICNKLCYYLNLLWNKYLNQKNPFDLYKTDIEKTKYFINLTKNINPTLELTVKSKSFQEDLNNNLFYFNNYYFLHDWKSKYCLINENIPIVEPINIELISNNEKFNINIPEGIYTTDKISSIIIKKLNDVYLDKFKIIGYFKSNINELCEIQLRSELYPVIKFNCNNSYGNIKECKKKFFPQIIYLKFYADINFKLPYCEKISELNKYMYNKMKYSQINLKMDKNKICNIKSNNTFFTKNHFNKNSEINLFGFKFDSNKIYFY